MKWQPGNAQHIGARSEQQDSFGFSDPKDRPFAKHAGIAAVVADGMGGLANGGAASAEAVRGFLEAYRAKTTDESIPDALLRSIQSANDAVMRLQRSCGAGDCVGTTLAAIVLHEDWLYWVSAGDSRVYVHSDGTLARLTLDHVYAADLEEQVSKGRITRHEADTHPQRAALTSYLGLESLPRLDRSVHAFPVKAGDCVLVCSDGLYRTLSDDEIAAALVQKDSRKACETLVDCAIAKQVQTQDNITAVAVKCRADESTARRAGKLAAAAAVLAVLVAGSIGVWRRSAPVIAQFDADRTQIATGQSATLRWTVNRGSATIVPDIGGVNAVSGTRVVSPERKTTYTLTVRNFFGSAQRSLAVDVLPPPPPPAVTAPVIDVFEALPARIVAGKSAVLKWSVQQARTVTIQPALDKAALRAAGSGKVSPAVTTTYTLKASGNGGAALATALVTVEPLPAHSLKIRFTSDKSSIGAGSAATLTWNVTGHPRSVMIDHGIGAVKPAGIRKVSPSAKTTYTLTATPAGGAVVTAAVTVDVLPPPRIERFEPVWDGDSWRLHWAVSGAEVAGTRVTIEPGVGAVSSSSPADGLQLESPPADRYTLTVAGPGGTVTKDLTLPPPGGNPQ